MRRARDWWASDIKRHYGMTVDQYHGLLNSQGGVCAICRGQNTNGRRYAVDHDHETGTVRGLLCSQCNVGLGMFRDSTSLLTEAISYLLK